MNADKIKRDFPIFRRKPGGKRLVFLDSASTSQKPRQVIEAVSDFYASHNANVHRSVYRLSEEATDMFEKSRENVSRMLNAGGYHIIFTGGCTEAINLVARGWGARNLGDRHVLSSLMEHHSNIVPWQAIGAGMQFLGVDGDGRLETERISRKVGLVSLTQASNVLGTVNDVRKISKEAHDAGALMMVDGAQSVPHMKVDLKRMGCDFLAFSGHKMLGPTGTGVLAVRKEAAEWMQPLLFGSDMIKEVTPWRTTFAAPPARFETGTPDVAGFVGLSAAIDYLRKVGMEKIERHERGLADYAVGRLDEAEGVTTYGPRSDRGGIVSFNVEGAHSHDIATVMDSEGVAIRSGHHCAQPLMRRFGVGSMARASFYLYNAKDDVDSLVDGLEKARRVLKL